MIPTKSNLNTDTCTPVSSNCVVWQGPDLACIDVCAGQPLSETMYNLATEICALKDQLNLTDLDLKCLIAGCVSCPDPEKTLAVVLQLLIDKHCELKAIVDELSTGTATAVSLVRMAVCFQYTDGGGDVIRDATVEDYLKKVGIKVCDLASQITALQLADQTLQDQIDNHEVRITALETAGTPQVTLTCINPGTQDLDVAIEAIEADYCTVKSALGTSGDLISAVGDECPLPVKKLADPTTDLWAVPASNVAEALNHMWLAICDLRSAVKAIQDNCCKVTCADILIDFDVKVDAANNEMTLFFIPKSYLPVGFYDCNVTNGNTFYVTDGKGNKSYFYVKLREDVFDDNTVLQNGLTITIPGAIDPTTGMTITSDVCLTDGTTSCVKCVTVNVAPAYDCCSVTATDTVTIIYKTCS